MKMTRAEKLAIMETAHAAQRAYREVLDQAHADIAQAIQKMPVGTEFTAAELASAAGVCHQAVANFHLRDERVFLPGYKKEKKHFVEILPDGSINAGCTIQRTIGSPSYIRQKGGVSSWNNQNYRYPEEGDSTEILETLAKLQK